MIIKHLFVMENDDHLGILTCSTFTHGVRRPIFCTILMMKTYMCNNEYASKRF